MIKPCPFCGGKSATMRQGSTFRWRTMECNECGAMGPETRVPTLGPRVDDEAYKLELATATWNERVEAHGEQT
jgi:Lar family restriction alleviation protein